LRVVEALDYKGDGLDQAYGPIVNCELPNGCKPVFTIETSLNPNGVFALSGNREGCPTMLALPGDECGSVLLYNLTTTSNYKITKLHGHPVAAIAISEDCRMMATCSEEGKNINLACIEERVLRTVSHSDMIIRTVRRGNSASVPTCLSFNSDASLLATASVSGSVHVFSIPDKDWRERVTKKIDATSGSVSEPDPEPKSFYSSAMSAMGRLYNAALPYVMKDFDATVNLSPNSRIVCGWTVSKDKPSVIVVESNGSLSSFAMPSCSKIISSHVPVMTIGEPEPCR